VTAAETLGLALRAEKIARLVEARQLGIVPWTQARLDLEREAVRNGAEDQCLRCHLVTCRLAVELDRNQLHLLAVEDQIGRPRLRRRIAAYGQPRSDAGRLLPKLDIQVDGFDQERRRRVIDPANRAGRGGHVLADIHGFSIRRRVVPRNRACPG